MKTKLPDSLSRTIDDNVIVLSDIGQQVSSIQQKPIIVLARVHVQNTVSFTVQCYSSLFLTSFLFWYFVILQSVNM